VLSRTIRQCRCGCSDQQGSFAQHRNKCCAEACLPAAGRVLCSPAGSIRIHPLQYRRCPLTWRRPRFQSRFSQCDRARIYPTPTSLSRQAHPVVAMMLHGPTPVIPVAHTSPSSSTLVSISSSYLRPPCKAAERIFLWRGVNPPPLSTIDNPVICHIANLASRASLRDTASYGAGLRKFHLFCNIFSIPEYDRLPASFELLHSFALWAVADPDPGDPIWSIPGIVPFEPVSVGVARKYLSAVRAWHIAQGWHPPLSDSHHSRINWSLRGLENLQGGRRKPLRPPITLAMLTALEATLTLSDPFDACIWAMASCAFFGMMRFWRGLRHLPHDIYAIQTPYSGACLLRH
jgi:hypothetical protein